MNTPPTIETTVYHVTLESRLGCLGEGLFPNPERGLEADWRSLERRYDDARPDHIRAHGISRNSAVFAWPTIELAHKDIANETHSEAPSHHERFAIVGITVEPSTTYMCNYERVGYGTPGTHYWRSFMSLADWLDNDTTESSGQVIRPKMKYPEVLVPGPINPSNLCLIGLSRNRVRHYGLRNKRRPSPNSSLAKTL